MPSQQESRCWVLVLVLGLIVVIGLTAVTLWFTLRTSEDEGQIGEHDWGSTQEQALVEEVIATSTTREHLQEPDLPALVRDGEDAFMYTTAHEQASTQNVFVHLEGVPAMVQDGEIAVTLPEELSKSKKTNPVNIQKAENVLVHSEHLEGIPTMVQNEENDFVHPVNAQKAENALISPEGVPELTRVVLPEERNKLKKTNEANVQKIEDVFVPSEPFEETSSMIRDGENAFVHPGERNKLNKMNPAMVQMREDVYVHPEHLEYVPAMVQKVQNAFLHPDHQESPQKKEPGPTHGYDNTFLSPNHEDRNPEHRNQLGHVESEDEHFFSQYFEYPHDRDHHLSSARPPEDEEPDYYNRGPEKYDGEEPEYSENPLASFLQQKLQDLYNWISSDEDLVEGDSGTGRELLEVVQAINRSLAEGNSSLLVDKLKQIYQSRNGTPNIVQSNSLASFGLLAFDLMLLRNVQQIAWDEDNVTAREMMQDPDVLALSALFMPPEEVRQLQDPGARRKDLEKEDRGILYDIMEFINGSLRAVLNLGRAYRDGSNVLDCVWTLYCRNLDKSAALGGPYGFLARINSLGLRLAMGDFPLESTLDLLVGETSRATTPMDCDKLFPKCKTNEAADVVLRSALG